MARRRRAVERNIAPDTKYCHLVMAKFINCLMMGGRKATAEVVFYESLEEASKKAGVSCIDFFEKVIENTSPLVEVRSRRVGGATYQVPMEVPSKRRIGRSIRWIVQYARDRSGKTIIDRLSKEFLDAYKGEGAAVKKRDEVHRMAEANRAFAHYKW